MDNELMNLEKKGGEQSTEKGGRGQVETDSSIHSDLCEMDPKEKPPGQLELCEVGDVTAAHEEGAARLGKEQDDWERHTDERNEKVGDGQGPLWKGRAIVTRRACGVPALGTWRVLC